MFETDLTVSKTCLKVVSLVFLTAEDFGVWRELEEEDESGFVWTEDDDTVATGSGCGGVTGLAASSLEQLRKRDMLPTKIKERSFFFMITKYSLQKGIDIAKTFLLSLKSL